MTAFFISVFLHKMLENIFHLVSLRFIWCVLRFILCNNAANKFKINIVSVFWNQRTNIGNAE